MDEHDHWFDQHWASICKVALHDSGCARVLYKELIHGLRTGSPGALSHPNVREFLVTHLEAALEVTPARVGAVMGINGRTKNRGDSHFGDAKHRFALWFCEETVSNNSKEPKRKEWPEIDDISDKGISDSSLDKWVKYARELLPSYRMFRDVI